jgi:hypothetical protein
VTVPYLRMTLLHVIGCLHGWLVIFFNRRHTGTVGREKHHNITLEPDHCYATYIYAERLKLSVSENAIPCLLKLYNFFNKLMLIKNIVF